jgi:CubicO group peptidase (beta-lactamase class C family)
VLRCDAYLGKGDTYSRMMASSRPGRQLCVDCIEYIILFGYYVFSYTEEEDDMKIFHLCKAAFIFGIAGIFLFTVLCSAGTLEAANPPADEWQTIQGESRKAGRAESFLRQVLDKSGATALSVAVIQGPQVVFQRSMGILDKKTKRAVNEHTVFRTASLSKPVFAYLVMKLTEEGVLELDKPLYQYLKRPLYEYPEYSGLKNDDRYKLLTARILLSHQSGFPNWRRVRPGGPLRFDFTPGEKFRYSGEGYRLLQFFLEMITGKGLNQLSKEKIFFPLGMTNSSFLWENRFDNNFAFYSNTGLRRFLAQTKLETNSAYSLLTNAADYSKFLLAITNGSGLKTETVEMMLKPQVNITSRSLHAPQETDPKIHEAIHLAWSLGWGRFHCPQGEAIFHVGFEEGCDNYAVVFLDRKTGIVIQSVITGTEGIAPQVVKELIGDIYSPFPWLNY